METSRRHRRACAEIARGGGRPQVLRDTAPNSVAGPGPRIAAKSRRDSFTFHDAEGLSYFSTDPKACANCHIMRTQYDGWQKASHHGAATCIDCHLPHSFFAKYLAKASNGWHHSKGLRAREPAR